jgi:protein gp37
MADLFERLPEGHPDEARMERERQRVFELIEQTPKLDWMLLTKRVENVERMVPWTAHRYPGNVWLGCTVENQSSAEERLLDLLELPAAVRFISAEPLLGPLVLSHVRVSHELTLDALNGALWSEDGRDQVRPLDWVITGGESGAHARPTYPRWFRDLRDECGAERVPFFFKQWGAWMPSQKKARRVVEYDPMTNRPRLAMLGKKKTGRKLFGREHNEFPRQLTIEAAVA